MSNQCTPAFYPRHESLPVGGEKYEDFVDQAAADLFVSQLAINGLEVTRTYAGACVYGVRVFYRSSESEVPA